MIKYLQFIMLYVLSSNIGIPLGSDNFQDGLFVYTISKIESYQIGWTRREERRK